MMPSSSLLRTFTCVMLLGGASVVHAQADVPTGLSGTYDLVLDFVSTNVSSNFPHKKGEKVRFVIDGAADTLCINGTLLSAKPSVNSVGNAYTWASNTNTYYEVALQNNALYEVNAYQGSTSTFAGQFTGSRTSTSTACTSATTTSTTTTTTTAPISITADAQSVFDLAAEVFPSLFTNGSALASYQGYVYKYFADSKIYVGIKDNAIWVMGGQYGNSPSNKGSISTVLSSLQTAKVNIAKAQAAAAIPTGTYNLTITGKYSANVSGFAISTPLSVTLANMPAPSTSDTNAIAQLVQTSFASASGIGNIKTTVINNTSSRITFRVECTATLTGVGNVTYDLTYDYTK